MITGLNEYQEATDTVAQYPGQDAALTETIVGALKEELMAATAEVVSDVSGAMGKMVEEGRNAMLPLIGVMQNSGLIYTCFGLAGEAGEFNDKVKKMLRDNNGEMSPALRDFLVLELGDVLWYVAQAGRQLNVTMEEIATRNMEKLLSRKARNTLSGSGDNR